MWDQIMVLVIESTVFKAYREAKIQADERPEIDEINRSSAHIWHVDDFKSLEKQPFFLMDATTGEFRSFVGESQDYRKAVIDEWIELFKSRYELDGSGFERYIVLLQVKSHLITEVNNA